MKTSEKISILQNFKTLIEKWESSGGDPEIRSNINVLKRVAHDIVVECRCLKLFTLKPPSISGGLLRQNVDAFDLIFEVWYGETFTVEIMDMLDEAIGVLKHGQPSNEKHIQQIGSTSTQIKKGFAFIVMAMDPAKPELDDVQMAIKETCGKLGIKAERIDDNISNERITDRILDAIKKAEFVIVDITERRPNVFYEAGYAHGFGKLPIYIAREGTALDFDIKDYPIIFFKNQTILKAELAKRLKVLSK